MEEILSSIRRIISDDEGEPTAAAAEPGSETAAEPGDDRQGEIDAMFDEAPAPAPEPQVDDDDDILELTDTVEDEPEPSPPPAMAVAEEEEELVSPAAVAAAAESLSALAEGMEPPLRDIGGITVERLAAEIMRPMLRDWLDRNLPGMVESLVRAEIRRIGDQVKR